MLVSELSNLDNYISESLNNLGFLRRVFYSLDYI